MNSTIKKESFGFLKKLAKNNNRDWFNANKDAFKEAHENIVAFSDALLDELNRHDVIDTPSGKKSVFRIYRDVRFSKDKTPYNTHWSGYFKRATKKRRGSYYFHLKPGNSFVAIGFWGPNPNDMSRIRKEIHLNPEGWDAILQDKTFKKIFGKLKGEQLATAPRGYEKDHPSIHLLRYKQYLLKFEFSNEEVLNTGFAKQAGEIYKKARPFLDFMSEVLTTNADGESLIE